MKPFQTYQYLEGYPMTERDKVEVGSKFWNEGKWDNFVLPFLPDDCKGQVLIDMGCNAGLFLKLAKEKGFERVVGVDSDKDAVTRGLEWRNKNGDNYKIILSPMEKVIDELPVADYTVLANAHYYFTINDWLDYLDKLQYKTRYCIIVTAEKHHINRCWASAGLDDIRVYFKNWEEVGFINELPIEGEIGARRLWAFLFKSPFVERIEMAKLDRGNHVQDQFYRELDEGKDYHDTRYYRIIEKYRRHKWSKERLEGWFEDRVKLYNDVKENGLKRPLYVDRDLKILDGNHRSSIEEHLGHVTPFVRKT